MQNFFGGNQRLYGLINPGAREDQGKEIKRKERGEAGGIQAEGNESFSMARQGPVIKK